MNSRLFSQIVSILFQPLAMPLFGFLFLYAYVDYFQELPVELNRMVFIVIGLGTFLLPLSFFPLYLYFKVIDSIEMHTRQERIMPLLLTLMFYYLTYQSLSKDYIPLIFRHIILASMAVVLLTEIVNFFYKISVHMTGTGSLVALVLVFVFQYGVYSVGFVVFPILIAGITAYARLRLNAHTPGQIYWGFSSGFVVMWILLTFVL